MDDPLRPKTVPLAAETILWFEFLLDPTLLTKHLYKQNPDPPPIELISQFISMSPDHQIIQYDLANNSTSENENSGNLTSEGLKIAKKQLALKILTLKASTFIKWNLDIIEKHLPIQKQISLLRDLCTISFGKICTVPIPLEFDCVPTAEGSDKAVRFALTLYHRWVLRLQILKDIAIKNIRPTMHLLMPPEPINFIAPEISPESSIEYLTNLCNSKNESFYIFTYDTLKALDSNSDEVKQDFDGMLQISNNELKAQLYYDLSAYYLYAKKYQLAKQCIIECQKYMVEMKKEYEQHQQPNIKDNSYNYCHINEDELKSYLLTLGVNEIPIKLIEKFQLSQLNNYHDIIEILKLDNQLKEIPMVNRRIVELDIEAVVSQQQQQQQGNGGVGGGGQINANIKKELEMQVTALNVIRNIFDDGKGQIFQNVDYFEKYESMDYLTPLFEGLNDVLPACSLNERNKIKTFLINCFLKNNHENDKNFLKHVENLKLFSNIELEDLKQQKSEEENNYIPALAIQHDWKWSSKISRIEIGSLERQLIGCTNATAVRKLLVKLAATNPSKPLWTVNPSWQIPTQLNSLLMGFQRGFLQDFSYVLLGKAKEMSAKKDFVGAVSMLSVLKSETQRPELSSTTSVTKLGKLVTWEILLIQICQCLEEWNQKSLDIQLMAQKCKQCLSSLQSGDNVMPRTEIVEYCAMMLLNLNDWQTLSTLDKRLNYLELPIAFATTFIEMEKLQKGVKKICRDVWDLVLAMFTSSNNNNAQQTSKRGGGGSGGGGVSAGAGGPGSGSGGRNSPNITISSNLYPFLKKIRDSLVFSLAISLLAKIHNILKDDPNFDINAEYMYLWPSSISNPIGYNIRSVSETLMWLLKEALKYYPQNTSYLKIKGDLELAIGNNEAAMRCYVNALITGSERIIDECIIRKMIKCSSNLGCYTEAAIFCQFLDDIDYSLAFKNLSEKSSNFYDAMDAYYNCISDPTLLEFIVNLHSKKGEYNKRLEAIAVMSNLELNANNNEEIKREAASIRKTRFLRALAKQYLL